MKYHIKVDEEARTVRFQGTTFGHGVGSELPLWAYRKRVGIIVAKKPGTTEWARRGESRYCPAEFTVLRKTGRSISDTFPKMADEGYFEAEVVVEFEIRKPEGGQS